VEIVTSIKVYETAADATGGIRGWPVHFEIHADTSGRQVAVQLANQIFVKSRVFILGPAVQAMRLGTRGSDDAP